jgi:hypothetical protein
MAFAGDIFVIINDGINKTKTQVTIVPIFSNNTCHKLRHTGAVCT